jgi:hypothetical protein
VNLSRAGAFIERGFHLPPGRAVFLALQTSLAFR